MPNLLAELRRLRAGNTQAQEPAPPPPPFNAAQLRQAIAKDQSLSHAQKEETYTWLDDPVVLNELRSGSIGAALTLLIGKFLNMKPRNQLLLSIAGFGIGKIIYDYKNDPKNFSRWNKQLRMYEIEH
ncbi:hypothetical protein EKK58_00150 [Candidatus Dependentiae bacterium]|nr:MAG: hypothetical protein EKK58_00150 [Candidatus Dependentiae bacterium]